MKQDYIQRNPMILLAIGEAMDRRVERIPVAEHTFSPAFERKMNRVIRAQSKPYFRFVNTNAKKAVLALATALLILLTMVFSVAALREPVVRFIVEVYEKFSNVFFHQQEDAYFPDELEVYYIPTWLPDGYQIDDTKTIDIAILYKQMFFDNADHDIELKQYTITDTVLRIDTESVQTKPVTVNGNAGLFYSTKGIQTLLWNNGQYGFLVSGPVAEAELLRMAESLREK